MPIGRVKLRIFRGILLLVPLGLCGWWFWSREVPVSSDFEVALDHALAPVIEERAAQAKLGASTSTQTRLMARQLAVSSVAYLGPRDLELWAELRKRVALSSPRACGKLWKGADETFIGSAVAELGHDTLTTYAEMLSRGFALRLERRPLPAIAPGAVERGVAAAGASLPEAERAAFEADVRRPDVSDERACELLLTLSRAVETLDVGARTDFYRALSSRMKQP
ncbi:MAG: hypothetical protein K0R38_2762 [Polyangiaceae bacterium]|jgi:hypothetical protein|nr:hypothetical protein [Polyangiaceae bacterium]